MNANHLASAISVMEQIRQLYINQVPIPWELVELAIKTRTQFEFELKKIAVQVENADLPEVV